MIYLRAIPVKTKNSEYTQLPFDLLRWNRSLRNLRIKFVRSNGSRESTPRGLFHNRPRMAMFEFLPGKFAYKIEDILRNIIATFSGNISSCGLEDIFRHAFLSR